MKSKIVKKAEGEERNARYAALSLLDKIAKVSAAPGMSKKQMARLVRAEQKQKQE